MSTTDMETPAAAVGNGHPPLVGKMMKVGDRLHKIALLQAELERAFKAYEDDRAQLSEEEQVTVERKFPPWLQRAWDDWRKEQATEKTQDRLGELSRERD